MQRIASVIFLAALALALAPAAPVAAAAAAPVVYAHRGGAGYAPENTLAAFRKTAALYGERSVWLELDTQPTADGVLVVMHDDSVDRTTNCTGKVNALTLTQLAPCNAADYYPGGWPEFVAIPTLEQVLIEGRDNGWRLMVELKDMPGEANFDATGTVVADKLIALVNGVGFPASRLLVQAFWPPAIDRIELLAPAIGTVLLTGASLNSAAPGVGFPATSNAVFSFLRGYEVSSPAFATSDFSATSVAIAHALGRQVVPWTIDAPASLALAASHGVDGVITNRPDLAYAAYA